MQLTCPKCRAEMRQYERSGITIDQCSECRGVFLDRGELEKLFEAEANWNRQQAGGAPPQAGGYTPPPPPPAQHQPGYATQHVPPPPPVAHGYPQAPGYGGQHYGYHGHHQHKYHGHYRNKRRRGFLGELFD